mmetsp:Transcript_33055/g.69566  ORF Transcript_33055/g.69566 Transcript_33055/m.69566 type:complete len:282 (+) Transcript_33055:21-866(+)
MTCYTSALSTAAYASAASHSPSTAAVRLFSLKSIANNINNGNNGPVYESATSKIVHLVRHAEGTHNLNEAESKLPPHFDANLTPRGVEQCGQLAKHTKTLDVGAVMVSPMTRCLETARLSFPHLYETSSSSSNNDDVPFIAHEEWRETVNFLCDSRRPKQILQQNYPRVSFDRVSHDHDPIWSHYETVFGSYDTHTSKRESDDAISLYNRAHSAWKVLLSRPEKHLALVGHSAFFMHMFTPLFAELEGVVEYGDDGVRELMTSKRFDNCELRSLVVDVPNT